MKTFLVCVYLVTDASISTKKEFCRIFGLGVKDFQKKGWARGRKPKGVQYWIVESDLDEAEQPEAHFSNVLEKVRKVKNQKLFNCKILDLAIFYSPEKTPFPSTTFPIKIINSFEKLLPGLKMEISFYPDCTEN